MFVRSFVLVNFFSPNFAFIYMNNIHCTYVHMLIKHLLQSGFPSELWEKTIFMERTVLLLPHSLYFLHFSLLIIKRVLDADHKNVDFINFWYCVDIQGKFINIQRRAVLKLKYVALLTHYFDNLISTFSFRKSII